MKNKWKTDKPLYDRSIIIDEENLPKIVKNCINELKKYDKLGDWFNYDLKAEELEVCTKPYVINKKITEDTYKKLLQKYGGIYD